MIVGLLFSLFMYLMGGVVGYIFGDYRWGIAFMVLFPAYIVFREWYADWKEKKKDENDRINQRGKYFPEEVARRNKAEELLKNMEEYHEREYNNPIEGRNFWFRKWCDAYREIEKLDYEVNNGILIDKRKLNKNK